MTTMTYSDINAIMFDLYYHAEINFRCYVGHELFIVLRRETVIKSLDLMFEMLFRYPLRVLK